VTFQLTNVEVNKSCIRQRIQKRLFLQSIIGVPYGMSYWQVGDSLEQNGSYKMALIRSKNEIVLKNSEHASIMPVLKLTKFLLFSTQHGRNPLLEQILIRKQ
jgi:hypothetical protein